MAKAKKTTFSVGVCLSLWLNVQVDAKNLEEALTIARELKRDDLVGLDGSVDVNDDTITVVAASQNELPGFE